MKSIFVGNLPFKATEEEIEQLFAAHGKVLSVKLLTDRETGKPRGFGFVEMEDSEAAPAIKALDGQDFQGRPLRINEASPREETARPPKKY